jgi:hypothetical protein
MDETLAGLAAGGQAVEAERRAMAVSALVRAERDLAELEAAPQPLSAEDDEDSRRAELRRRLARFVEAERSGAADAVLERFARSGFAE